MPLISDMFCGGNYGGERELGHWEMSLVSGNLSKQRLPAGDCSCPDWIYPRSLGE